jgi:tRNA(Ile2) C34 agmatinyltransferase TiaS
MTDDIVARLRSYAYLDDAFYNPWVYAEAADEIEWLEARLAQARAEIEELRLQNEILVQTTAELCDRCGWRMKFPGQPCRHCEAPARAALEGEKKDD